LDENLVRLKNCRVNHLILLVGTNPLPNWVAAHLLLMDTEQAAGGPRRIWLLHSDGSGDEPSTKEVAQRLKDLLWQQLFREIDQNSGHHPDQDPILLYGVPSSNSIGIKNSLADLLPRLSQADSIGLNYTGGTKPMAVHVYRFLEQHQQAGAALERKRLVFSYLDPRHMALRVEGKNAGEMLEFRLLEDDALRTLVTIKQKDLAKLHGYEPPKNARKENWNTSREQPGLYHLARAIGKVYALGDSQPGLKQWFRWLDADSLLPPEREDNEALEAVIQAMDDLAGGAHLPLDAKAQIIAEKILPGAEKGLRSCRKWFLGVWLEEYARAALEEAVGDGRIMHSADRDLKYICVENGKETDDFQLDAVTLCGYQLFALSCTSDGAWVYGSDEGDVNSPKTRKKLEKKETAKEHLMEIYVRARQLGGDEARIGLVCFYPSPKQLENEIQRSWDAQGKVRVFGRKHFADLADAFEDWFKTANLG